MAEEKTDKKMEEQKPEQKKEEPITEKKAEQKQETKKGEGKFAPKKAKRDFAIVNGLNLHISTKVGAHICDAIRYKDIDTAMEYIDQVAAGKKAVKMNNREVGHRHDAGMMAGRYPMTAAKEFVKLLKNLKANAVYHEVELEKAIISKAICNMASRPYKRGGAQAKRSHVMLMLEKKEEKKQNDKNKSRGTLRKSVVSGKP